MAAGTPVSFAASAFESSKTPASLTPGQLTDEDCTGGVTPVASVGVGFSAVKSGSKWQKVRENLDLDGKPSPRGRRMLGRKPTATKKDWSVLKIDEWNATEECSAERRVPCAIAGAEFS